MKTTTTEKVYYALNAIAWVRYYVTSYGPQTIQNVYAELAGQFGIAGDLAEDVLDGAGITASPEQIGDQIVFFAIAQTY